MAIHWTELGIDLTSPTVPEPVSAEELAIRWKGVYAGMERRGLEALLVFGNESEFSNVRYLTEYWPLFESGAALFAAGADPILLCGPESETYAELKGRTGRVELIESLRESADPSYPEVELGDYASALGSLGVTSPTRIGIAGSFAANLVILEELREAFPDAELVRADDIVSELRTFKSPWEMENLRAAFSISEIALASVLERLKPGMTELQVVGIAQAAMYANGAEYEGMPQYVLAGPNSRAAIARPSGRVIRAGEIVQLNISARVNGYSSGVGRPIVLGRASDEQRSLIEFCREAHYATREWVRAGVPAAEVATKYREFFDERDRSDAFLYGPCTGLGLMETERPWIESDSDYTIAPNMAFQFDTFAQGPVEGVRWENGGIVHADRVEMLSDSLMDVYEY